MKVSLIKQKLDGNARPQSHAVDVTGVSRTQLLPLHFLYEYNKTAILSIAFPFFTMPLPMLSTFLGLSYPKKGFLPPTATVLHTASSICSVYAIPSKFSDEDVMYRYFELYKKNELQSITYCTSNDCIQSREKAQ